MDKQKVARELLKVAKVLTEDTRSRKALSFQEIDSQFGKVAFALVELEKITRSLKIDRQVQKSMHDSVQDAIESIDNAMDEWSEYFN